MPPVSYARHRFPPVVIRHAVRLSARSALSHRDVEDLPAERGPDVPDETVRRWFLRLARKFTTADPELTDDGAWRGQPAALGRSMTS